MMFRGFFGLELVSVIKMRHILLCLFICLLMPAINVTAQNSAPSAEVLIEGWRQWATDIRKFVPRYASYSLEEPSFRELGFERADVKTYLSTNALFAREQVLHPANSDGSKKQSVAIHSQKYYALLGYDFAENGWFVESLQSPQEWKVVSDYISFLEEIPGDISGTGRSIEDIYKWSELEKSDDYVDLEIIVLNPIKELSAAWGEVFIDKMTIRFHRDINWLPSQISKHFGYENGFWYHAKLEDWSRFDNMLLPRLITESSTMDGQPFLRCKLSEFRKVDLKEIEEHCSLTFYGIPNEDLRPKQMSVFFLVSMSIACALACVWLFGKFRRFVE